jgi:hypothetical protein
MKQGGRREVTGVEDGRKERMREGSGDAERWDMRCHMEGETRKETEGLDAGEDLATRKAESAATNSHASYSAKRRSKTPRRRKSGKNNRHSVDLLQE